LNLNISGISLTPKSTSAGENRDLTYFCMNIKFRIRRMSKNIETDYQVCSYCLLDSSVPQITFNDEGLCNYCQQFFERESDVLISPEQRESQLNQIISKIQKQGEGKPYDCIIGLSGGIDSSYVAWLVKKHGLRALAVHFDNGWNSEIAVGNIEMICKLLGFELYTYVVDWEEFRDLQLSFLKAGVANVEIPTDHGIFATLYKLARKFKVNYIIDGLNHGTEFGRKDFFANGWIYTDLKHLSAIHKRFGTIKLKTFPRMSVYKKALLQQIAGIQQISILNYVEYNKAAALKVLENELEWRSYGGKHHESLFTKWHQLVYLKRRFGFDKRKLHLSDLILSGQITRDEAIAELSRPAILPHELVQLETYVQKKLGLTPTAYETLITSPPVNFTEYPNDKWLFNLYNKWRK